MKMWMMSLVVIFSFITITPAHATPGDTCGSATPISSLPFTDANTTNCGCSNDGIDYSSCMGYYDSGYDGFYTYTNNTGADFLVEVCATDHVGGDYLGIGLYEGCPSSGAACLGFMGSYTLNTCFMACLENGVTYYLLVDNWASPNCADNYTLTLTNEGPCPTPPPNDTCAGAIPLTCGTCVEGSTLFAANDFDCNTTSSPFNGPDVVYSFTLTETQDVTIVSEADYDADFALSSVCDNGSAATLFCVDRTGTQTDPSCGDIAHHDWGYAVWTGSLDAGTYYIWIDAYQGYNGGYFSLELICSEQCNVDCPPGSSAEAEPCGSDLNGGCNAATPVFEPISCGETVCGTAWYDGTNRDNDWYVVNTTAPSTVLTWSGMAEFPLQLILITDTDDCNITTAFPDTGGPCEEVSTSATVGPGTYWLYAGPQFITTFACGTNDTYYATLTCQTGTSGVDLIYFDAVHGNRGVKLTWGTNSEMGLIGFNLYRQKKNDDGTYQRQLQLNNNLIQTLGDANHGAEYVYIDLTPVEIGVTYRYILKLKNFAGQMEDLATKEITILKLPPTL